MTIATVEMCIAGAIGVAAAIEDLARRTVSNWMPVALVLSGLACQGIHKGWTGAAAAMAGAAAGGGVFLVFYLLGGMGGGDVKLMAGFGALLGAGRLVEAAFWTALMGGLFAAGVLGLAAVRKRQQTKSIPYAPAIVAGVWLTLLGRN